jgi:phosphate/sulfate permease
MDLVGNHEFITIVVALLLWEIIRQAIAYFFKKFSSEEYLTKKDCEACSQRQKSKTDGDSIKDILDCMQVMRGILLVVAVKSGVNVEALKDLTKM